MENFVSISRTVAEKMNFFLMQTRTYAWHTDMTDRLTPLFTSRAQGNNEVLGSGDKLEFTTMVNS